MSEDVNVEHLPNILTSTDKDSTDVWNACPSFIRHLYWHKKWLVMLGPKIEKLPDNHCSKPECLVQLSLLVSSVGNHIESKRLLTYALILWREQKDLQKVADSLRFLATTNKLLHLPKEGIPQAEEAFGIYGQLGKVGWQGDFLCTLALLLHDDNQLDAAEEAVSSAITLLSGKEEQFKVYKCHYAFGKIYHSEGKIEEAIGHFEAALKIAPPHSWHYQLFQIHYALAKLFSQEGKSDDAHHHIGHAKSHATSEADT